MKSNGYKQTDIGTIPEGWGVKPLGEIATLQRGKDLPKQKWREGLYPIVGSNGVIGLHDEYFLEGAGVVTGRSGTVGKATYVDGRYWAHNTSLYVKDFHGNHPKFVYYLFQKVDFQKYATGVSVPTLNRNFVHLALLPLPPLPEQRTIAAILSKIQQAIEVQEKIIERTKELKKSLMAKLFTEGLHGEELKETEIGLMPKSWEIVSVETLFECHDGKRIPVTKADRTAGQFPYYGASGITDYVINYIFDGDFLLVAEDGENLESRKLPIAFIACGKFWVNNHAHILKIRKGSLKFYEQYIAQMDIRDYLTGTTRPKLTKGLLMNMRVPNPSEEEQEEIGQRLKLIEEKVNIHTRKHSVLQALFKSMLHQLMTGTIRVNNIELSAP